MNIDLKAKPFYLNEEQIDWVNDILASMSTKEKLHQLFCLVLYNDDEAYCRYLGEDIQPGGFMCRVMSAQQCVKAVEYMDRYSRIPQLVAANLEAGGSGMIKEGTNFGKPMQIAATANIENARRLGEICGEEGSAVGGNWAFAPVVDINYNWRNPVTNVRTFGSDINIVTRMGVTYVKELQRHNVAASAKHFPGDGCDERDQHVSLSVNSLSCEEWDNSYGKVYGACIDAGVKTVMVGHILQPAYTRYFAPETKDSDMLPASINKALITGLLRKKLGFNGLVVTDSSVMAGLAAHLSRAQMVPMTIAAGCDMFLFTKNLEEDIFFMEEGYRKGIISEERLNEAVTRILALKASLGLPEKREEGTLIPVEEEAEKRLGSPVYKKWSQECAERSITLVKEEKGIFPITPERFPRVLFCPLDREGNQAEQNTTNGRFCKALEKEGFCVDVFIPRAATEGVMSSVGEMQGRYDLIIYSAAIGAKYQPVSRITWSGPQGANVPTLCHTIPTVFISFDNPYHLIDVPQMRTYINCYAGTQTVIEALLDKMSGKSEFVGISPVDAFCGKWDTRVAFGSPCEALLNTGEEYINKKKIKGLIFDLDGVLISTDYYHYLAWKKLADQMKIPFNEKDNEQLRGVSRMESLEIVLSKKPSLYLSEKEKETLAQEKNDCYREYLKKLTPDDVAKDIRNTLQELRAKGYLLAVGSSSKNAKFILNQTGLTEYFDAIADGNDIQRSKPDPEVFIKAAHFLGLEPDVCAVVEDAEAGLEAAAGAGMLPIAYANACGSAKGKIQLQEFSDLLKL